MGNNWEERRGGVNAHCTTESLTPPRVRVVLYTDKKELWKKDMLKIKCLISSNGQDAREGSLPNEEWRIWVNDQ